MLTTTRSETHAAQRLAERYGIPLDDALKHRLVREIERAEKRRARFRLIKSKRPRHMPERKPVVAYLMGGHHSAGDQAVGRQRWAVRLDETVFLLVYDPRERVVVTFLPPGAMPELRAARVVP